MNKNYYDILNVAKTASEEDIKKSCRITAMQCHPDRNPGDRKAEEKFKEPAEWEAIGQKAFDLKKYYYAQYAMHKANNGKMLHSPSKIIHKEVDVKNP